jgi:VanZ family protein
MSTRLVLNFFVGGEKEKIRIFKMLHILFVEWMVFVTICSLIPAAYFPSWIPLKIDKLGHFVAYFVASLLFYLTFRMRFNKSDIYAVLFATGYGVLMELGQLFSPGRDCSVGDMAINFSGALFFFLLYRILWGEI